ncbi:MAG TPA: hypothetical protein VE890_12150 [Thermoguttaceae bacterium]|nr:hypothetical protein [Thermoguttaceae bacterium]
MFGRRLRRWEYAGLVGAPDSAQVDLYPSTNHLYLDVSDPLGARYRAHHEICLLNGRLVLVNEGCRIHIESMQRKGLGLRMFHRQLENAKTLGITRIETNAGRKHGENGYYTWPRFGFDGRLPTQVQRRLPSSMEGVCYVLDLMACERGRQWWKQHGRTISVAFDMADRSRSQLVFDQYLHRYQ